MDRTYKVDDGYLVYDFMQSSRDHINASQKLFESDAWSFDSAGYLAHLGIEQLLKAWLLGVDRQFDGTHNLQSLYKQIKKLSTLNLPDEHFVTLKMLDKFFGLRYPNPRNPTEVGDADMKKIRSLQTFVLDSMPVEIMDQYQADLKGNGGNIGKGGRTLFEKKI